MMGRQIDAFPDQVKPVALLEGLGNVTSAPLVLDTEMLFMACTQVVHKDLFLLTLETFTLHFETRELSSLMSLHP